MVVHDLAGVCNGSCGRRCRRSSLVASRRTRTGDLLRITCHVVPFFTRNGGMFRVQVNFWQRGACGGLFPSSFGCVGSLAGRGIATVRLTAGRARRWARSLRNALVSMQEDAVDDVEGPQAPIALPVDNDLLVLLEVPREQSHVAGLCGPRHCAVELAMREDRLVQIYANALTKSLSLALVDRHGPG